MAELLRRAVGTLRIRPLDFRQADRRLCDDLNIAYHTRDQAYFRTPMFGDPGATAATRLGCGGR